MYIATVYLEGPPKSLLGQLSGVMRAAARLIPGAPSAKSRDQWNSCEAALAWYAVASAIQALLPRVPMSTRFCSPVSGGLLHSSQLNWGTLSTSIGCRRVTSSPTYLNGDNWPPGRSRFPLLPRGTVSRPVFVILASVFPVLGRNWKPTYSILPLDCLVSLFIL